MPGPAAAQDPLSIDTSTTAPTTVPSVPLTMPIQARSLLVAAP